jgi:hypothetical protein
VPQKRKYAVDPGQRFGRGVVVDPEIKIPQTSRGKVRTRRGARLRCDCGTAYEAPIANLVRGRWQSCGCGKSEGRPSNFVEAGQRFGRGVVIEPEIYVARGHRGARLRCDCGNEYEASLSELLTAQTRRSCGCDLAERYATRRTHGLSSHPLFGTWEGMMRRCYNPNHVHYRNYGGRGITVCPRWHDAAAFIEDIETILGARPDGMTLDRKRNGLGYKPSNVRWAPPWLQLENKTGAADRMERRRLVFERWQRGESVGQIARELSSDKASYWAVRSDVAWIERRISELEKA